MFVLGFFTRLNAPSPHCWTGDKAIESNQRRAHSFVNIEMLQLRTIQKQIPCTAIKTMQKVDAIGALVHGLLSDAIWIVRVSLFLFARLFRCVLCNAFVPVWHTICICVRNTITRGSNKFITILNSRGRMVWIWCGVQWHKSVYHKRRRCYKRNLSRPLIRYM